MTEKELREIKRRFRPDKTNIPEIRGCIVNENGAIVGKFSQSVLLSAEEESEKLLGTMKKVLSGSIGTNLIDIPFSTKQVAEGAEHALLMKLRETHLKDDGVLDALYAKIAGAVKLEGNYAILIANDVYDVFKRGKNGEEDESTESFNYIIVAVCALKNTDSGLCFKESDSRFHQVDTRARLLRPEIGFMFPAFDDRTTNIYNAIYYSAGVENNHPEFIEAVFAAHPPMPPKEQGASFAACLKAGLSEECDLNTLRILHTRVEEMVAEHKEAKIPEPLTLSKAVIKDVLRDGGIAEEKIEKFGAAMDESFGQNAELAPKNVINTRRFELKTPDVTIKVNPERRELVSTQIINGERYILIKAENVEINGIALANEEEKQ